LNVRGAESDEEKLGIVSRGHGCADGHAGAKRHEITRPTDSILRGGIDSEELRTLVALTQVRSILPFDIPEHGVPAIADTTHRRGPRHAVELRLRNGRSLALSTSNMLPCARAHANPFLWIAV